MSYTFNVPPTGPRQGKVWGDTQLVFVWNGTEAHLIRVNRGGFCSRHIHRKKWNRFLLLSGKLKVTLFRDSGAADETILTPGWITDIPPFVYHEFEALEDSIAIEFYWTVLSENDIERDDDQLGGMRDET